MSLRVAIFSEYYKPAITGTVISTSNQITQLLSLGHQVKLFTTSTTPNPDLPYVCWLPYITLFRSSPYTTPLPIYTSIRKNLIEFQPDIVHLQHPFMSGIIGLALARSLGIPVVYTFHTLIAEYFHSFGFPAQLFSGIIRSYLTGFCNAMDTVIAPSQSVKLYLLAHGVRTNIEVNPTGIDLQRFAPILDKSNHIRQQFNIKPDAKLLLYVGRCVKEKNLHFLINQFKHVHDQIPEAKLMIVGEGPALGSLKTHAQQAMLSDSIIFAGSKPNEIIHKIYQAADIFVLTSTTETQGIVIIEALASGLPVIALCAQGQIDFIQNGINGIICSPSEFSDGIIEVLFRKDTYQIYQQQARASVSAFSWEETINNMVTIYNRCIDKKKHMVLR